MSSTSLYVSMLLPPRVSSPPAPSWGGLLVTLASKAKNDHWFLDLRTRGLNFNQVIVPEGCQLISESDWRGLVAAVRPDIPSTGLSGAQSSKVSSKGHRMVYIYLLTSIAVLATTQGKQAPNVGLIKDLNGVTRSSREVRWENKPRSDGENENGYARRIYCMKVANNPLLEKIEALHSGIVHNVAEALVTDGGTQQGNYPPQVILTEDLANALFVSHPGLGH